MKRVLSGILLVVLIGVVPQLACVNVRTPDVRINAGPPPEDINSAQVPVTSTHEEARIELEKAYRQIRYLERENRRLQERGDKYKEKYKRLKDKYDD